MSGEFLGVYMAPEGPIELRPTTDPAQLYWVVKQLVRDLEWHRQEVLQLAQLRTQIRTQ